MIVKLNHKKSNSDSPEINGNDNACNNINR